MERRRVDMVRLEKPEEVYDVEEVLGRDASSVFPSLQAQLDPMEQLKAAIGAKRFVTETELEEIKAARGLNVDDGTAAADKPLAEILAERKKAKQDAFDDQWRQMKTGKNRPLDADELDFYNSLAQQEAEQHRRMRQEEDEELAAFRQAVAAAAQAKAAAAEAKAAAAAADGEGDAAAAGPGPGSGDAAELGRSGSGPSAAKPAVVKVYSKPALPVLKPIVKAKPKGSAGARAQQGNSSSAAGQQSKTKAAEAAGSASPRSKKQRLEDAAAGQQQQQQQQDAGAGLAGLLGGYGSGSDDADD